MQMFVKECGPMGTGSNMFRSALRASDGTVQGLPVHHAGDEGSAVRQRRRGESREVLHGVGPGTPGV